MQSSRSSGRLETLNSSARHNVIIGILLQFYTIWRIRVNLLYNNVVSALVNIIYFMRHICTRKDFSHISLIELLLVGGSGIVDRAACTSRGAGGPGGPEIATSGPPGDRRSRHPSPGAEGPGNAHCINELCGSGTPGIGGSKAHARKSQRGVPLFARVVPPYFFIKFRWSREAFMRCILVFFILVIWFGWLFAATTAYDVPAGVTTWGQALSPSRTAIMVIAHDADASLQTYLDGVRLDSVLVRRGQPYPYWGEVDSINIVRPIETRATVQLGPPGVRSAPYSGGYAIPSWSLVKVYDGESVTANDTALISTGWGESDGGYIHLISRGSGVTNSGGSPQLFFNTVLDGRWIPLFILEDGTRVSQAIDILDGAVVERLCIAFQADADIGSQGAMVFGDSVMVRIVPNGGTAGTVELWAWYKKD